MRDEALVKEYEQFSVGERIQVMAGVGVSGSTGVIDKLVGSQPEVAIVNFDNNSISRTAISTVFLEKIEGGLEVYDEIGHFDREMFEKAAKATIERRGGSELTHISEAVEGALKPVREYLTRSR